ncbi:hypothetical protein C8R44DRAFT_725217 [Mycena epipterygia]|nr:hypothetical protein C8R44DRAFT_725217 [Mycena epipterygia]
MSLPESPYAASLDLGPPGFAPTRWTRNGSPTSSIRPLQSTVIHYKPVIQLKPLQAKQDFPDIQHQAGMGKTAAATSILVRPAWLNGDETKVGYYVGTMWGYTKHSSTGNGEGIRRPLVRLMTHRVIVAASNYTFLALHDVAIRAMQPVFFATPIELGVLGLYMLLSHFPRETVAGSWPSRTVGGGIKPTSTAKSSTAEKRFVGRRAPLMGAAWTR